MPPERKREAQTYGTIDSGAARFKNGEEKRRLGKLSMISSVIVLAGVLGFLSMSAKSYLSVTTSQNQSPEFVQATNNLEEPYVPPVLAKNTTRESKPHVIFMLVDDQGFNDVGYQSSDLSWATPVIDKMAGEGVKLFRYYTMHLCTPARSALLSGKYPFRTGMQHDVIQPSAPWGLPLKHQILPSYMQDLGYSCHMVGKWHIGFYNELFLPTNRGFETYLGYLGDQEHYRSHKYDKNFIDGRGDSMHFYDFIATEQGKSEYRLLGEEDGILNVSSAIVFTERASQIMRNNDNSIPLFLYLAWQNVHGPLDMVDDDYFFATDVDPETLVKIKDIPSNARRHFAKLTVQLDNQIAKVKKVAEKYLGVEDVVYVYASDNGGCRDSGGYNTPLRGGKHYLYEGGVRVPAFISGGIIPKNVRGTMYNGLFHVTDWIPTITGLVQNIIGEEMIDMANLGLDGVNHWPSIATGSKSYPRTEIILNIDHWTTTQGDLLSPLNFSRGAIISGDFKLIMNEFDNRWYSPLTLSEWESVGSSTRTISDCTTDYSKPMHTRLFNITADPNEEKDLYDTEPEMVERLHRLYREAMKEMVPPAYQREMDDAACGVWEKYDNHFVPWCEIDCPTESPTKYSD